MVSSNYSLPYAGAGGFHLTYGQFLVLFLGVPLLVLSVLSRRELTRRAVFSLIAISAVALVYTGPWDNLIVVNGVWSYGRRQVLGIVIGHVPVEEYAFYVLQVGVVGLLTFQMLARTQD